MMKRTLFAALSMAMILGGTALFGQSTNAAIVGSVTDSTNLVIPGAAVTVTNLGTSLRRSTTTESDGSYAVSNLPIGAYEVAVESQGFKRFLERPVNLAVNQTARVNATLQPGQVTESITVEATQQLISSEQSSVGQVVDNKTIVELPLNGRNFIRLGSLIPGTTRGAPADTTTRSRQGNEGLTANGMRSSHNNYTLDGIDNNDINLGLAVLIPSVDALQEFKVQTANYSAEFGRGAGAVVNVVIKGGTNALHGTLFEFLRNDKLDARNTFAPSRNPLRRNQFGFAVGGPVLIPGVYNGRNRTFFFFNYEGLRERRAFTSGTNTPTAAQRAGDFTGQPVIYDPLSLDAQGNRTAFAGNRIPAARISPIAVNVLKSLGLPNNADPSRNYLESLSNRVDADQIHIRGDHAFSPKDQLMVRLSRSTSNDVAPAIAYNGQTTVNKPRGGVAGYTRVLSARAVNDFRFGFQRYGFDLLPDAIGQDLVTPLGLPVFGADPSVLRYPGITIRNFSGLGGNVAIPVFRAENNYQFVENFSVQLGRHSLKLGGDLRLNQFNNKQPQTVAGQYIFNGPFTAVRGQQYANGLPDMLLGLPSQQGILSMDGYHPNYLRNQRLNLFVQDDMQVSRKLTVNVGLRWERDGSWTEKYNRWAYFDFQKGEVVYPKGVATDFKTFPYPFRFDGTQNMTKPSNKSFAPRLGFAFRPFADGSTVIRAAVGIFWAQSVSNPINNSAGTPPPFFLRQTLISSTTTPELRFGVFPGVSPSTLVPVIPSFFTHDPFDFRSGYVTQWNFGVERQVLRDLAFKGGYVGSRGNHLEMRFEGNGAVPPAAGAIQNRRVYPKFGSLTTTVPAAFSSYHSLQLTAEKRFSKGLQFLVGYTWAKSLDSASSWGGVGSENFLPQNPLRWDLEKGRSAHDLRQRLTASYVYQLPVHFHNRILDYVLGSWETSGIVSLQTGFPFTVLVGGDIPNIGANGSNTRANVVGDWKTSNQNIDNWFNR
ncbi:MAG: carboxypeptidase-like regulatory domain-containing protein, partial [Bryobacteraceae bacterium]